MSGTFADHLVEYARGSFVQLVRNCGAAGVRTGVPFIAVAVCNLLLIAAGTLYVTLLSQVVLPLDFTPVKISLGTFSVFTVSATLGRTHAVSSLALYAVLGLSGLPVFQGWRNDVTVTMGYVVGYIFVAYLIGKLAESGSDRKILSSFGTMLTSVPLLYIPGVAWLMYSMHITSIERGLELGFYPFLLGDAVKILAAGLLMPGLWKVFERISRTKGA